MEWLKTTLQTYPEIAILLSMGIGYWIGAKTFRGFSLGAVTGTLLTAVVIGQLDIAVTGPVRNLFFLLFLFAVGYGIGPQFVRGLAKDGLPQAGFAAIMAIFSLVFPLIGALIAGYDLGSAAGLYAGSQTISASMGLATDALHRVGLSAPDASRMAAAIPVAYAVTYIFGTIGSAFLLAQILPKVMRINLYEACKDYESKNKSADGNPTAGTAWHEYELRAYKLRNCADTLTVGDLERKFPIHTVFVEGVRRDGKLIDFTDALALKADDVLALGGDHPSIVNFSDTETACFTEVEDRELIAQPYVGVDVFVSHKQVHGKTLQELGSLADARGVFLRKIRRGLGGAEIPVLATTKLYRGDVVTLSGLDKNVKKAARDLGVIDARSTATDVSFLALAIVIGALVGAMVVTIDGIPITLSTAGGALIAGIVFGWIRSIHPTFGYIPESTVWFMNSFGLNVFIACVGLSAGPGFIAGLRELGVGLFFWGIFATTLPLVLGAFIGRYLFKFHPAILFGCCAGARTTTAALGMITEKAKSNVPGLGYTVTYAVGNTLLTMWGLVLVLVLARITA